MTKWLANGLSARRGPIKSLLLFMVLIAVVAGCDSDRILATDDLGPSKLVMPETVDEHAAQPGAGSPEVLRLLQAFNNQVVACYARNEVEYVTGSHLTLLTSVLRFPPTPGPKLSSLLNTLTQHINIARRDSKMTAACADVLAATIASIEEL